MSDHGLRALEESMERHVLLQALSDIVELLQKPTSAAFKTRKARHIATELTRHFNDVPEYDSS